MFHEMENKKRGKMGKDVTMEIKLTFLEAALGCIKEVKYNIGSNNEKSRRGKSKVGNDMKMKVVDLKIPPGVDTVTSTYLYLIFNLLSSNQNFSIATYLMTFYLLFFKFFYDLVMCLTQILTISGFFLCICNDVIY